MEAKESGVDLDETVIKKVVGGNIALFETLIRRYNSLLYKVARSYGFNHQDAEDLMQDTHVAAYLALSKFKGESSYKTWICRIMIHNCYHRTKKSSFKNEIPTEPQNGLKNGPMYRKETDNSTEKLLLKHELSAILQKTIESIPVNYRTVFVLREQEGFSVAETADLLNITPINVKVRLNRAKDLLKKQLLLSYSAAELYSFNLIYCDGMVKKVFEKIAAETKVKEV